MQKQSRKNTILQKERFVLIARGEVILRWTAGKCSFCGRFGHKAEVCRDRLKSDQKDALKKANYKKDKERKMKKKIKAKKIKEYEGKIESLKSESPESSEVEFDTSEEESSDPDEQSPSTRVKKVQSAK